MQTINAVKKLTKSGFQVTNNGSRYQAKFNQQIISFSDQSGDITCIKIRKEYDIDDIRQDYSAGVFCDNLTQAIKLSY